ncbi:nucleoporin [Salix suchowensis]|nr:nucleoporin [Salix suchowensis]
MASVCGTRDGRIFMCGPKMVIYTSCITRKRNRGRITAVVSDPSRDCFYTLTSKNNISVYKPNGDKAIQHMRTLSGLYKAAADKAPGSPALTPQNFQIIALHPIEISESRTGLQLLAITANGVRLYFSPTMTYGYGPSTSSAPGLRALQLTHIRLPPTSLLHPDIMNAANRPPVPSYGASQSQQSTTQPFIMTSIESSCYSQGLTLASQQGDTDGTDFLLCLSPDLTRIGILGQVNMQPQVQQPSFAPNPGVHQMPLAEYATLLSIPGRTWAMAQSPGLHLRLVQGHPLKLHSQTVAPYSFGRDQTCAMLLGLACGNTFFDMPDSATSPMNITNVDIATVAKQAFYDFGERPMWAERHVYGMLNRSLTCTLFNVFL